MFAPHQFLRHTKKLRSPLTLPSYSDVGNNNSSYSSRLMQHLGIGLYQWLLQDCVSSSLAQSQGIAIGQGTLRLRSAVLGMREAKRDRAY